MLFRSRGGWRGARPVPVRIRSFKNQSEPNAREPQPEPSPTGPRLRQSRKPPTPSSTRRFASHRIGCAPGHRALRFDCGRASLRSSLVQDYDQRPMRLSSRNIRPRSRGEAGSGTTHPSSGFRAPQRFCGRTTAKAESLFTRRPWPDRVPVAGLETGFMPCLVLWPRRRQSSRPTPRPRDARRPQAHRPIYRRTAR